MPDAIDILYAHLRTVRLPAAGMEEAAIRDLLARHCFAAGLYAQVEYRFAPRCRADIYVAGVVIEVKKRRPPTADVLCQLARYAAAPRCTGIILVLEKSVALPDTIEGKPVRILSLNSLWGVAV